MNEQLKREEDDLCGKRGLEPNSERQTFEVEVPSKFREQYEDVVRPLRQGDIQQQRRIVPNTPMGKFNYPGDREIPMGKFDYPRDREFGDRQWPILPELTSWFL